MSPALMIATLNVNPAICHERNKKSAPEIFGFKIKKNKQNVVNKFFMPPTSWKSPCRGQNPSEVKLPRSSGLVATVGDYIYITDAALGSSDIFPEFYGLSLALVFAQQNI